MLHVRGERIQRRIDELAALVDPASPPYTRRSFTDTYARGRAWLREELLTAGLDAHLDPAANLVGVRQGGDPDLAAIVIGSHIDTVVGGGRFDGIAGVVIALEIADVLADHGRTLRHPLHVVDFLAEEPSVYGVACVGSRAFAGLLTADHLNQRGPDGETLAEGMARMGAIVDTLRGPLAGATDVAAFLELHIEQGRRLERSRCVIGIVSGVVGIRRYRLTITGQANHAGTTAMADRRDALVAASRVITDVHDRARSHLAPLVATIGRIDVSPNSPNVIAGTATLILETRAPDEPAVEAFVAGALEAAERSVAGSGCQLQVSEISHQAPVPFDVRIQAAIAAAASRRGHPAEPLFSGAGHDAAQLTQLWPAGMLFVPSRDGVSHHADEWTEPEHLVAGAETMLDAVLELDDELDA